VLITQVQIKHVRKFLSLYHVSIKLLILPQDVKPFLSLMHTLDTTK